MPVSTGPDVALEPKPFDVVPNGQVRRFAADETIVTKTDLKGKITYANDVYLRVSACTEAQSIGSPHNMIRHPDMPAGIYKLLWDRLHAKQEIFVYIVNLALDGVAYWVFAHATPTINAAGKVMGYHSTRRTVPGHIAATLHPLYKQITAKENTIKNRRQRAEEGLAMLDAHAAGLGFTFDEWMWSLADVSGKARP